MFLEKLYGTLYHIDDFLWGPALLFLLIGTGLYLNVRLKFLPLRRLKYALKLAVGMEHKKNAITRKRHDSASGKGVSPFSALMNELATTIGTGNIVGVATAMVLGGPGALFWMMISAFLGMATKLVESMLAVKYRIINRKGEYVGGPMYTLERGFQKKGGFWGVFGKKLGFLFSFFAVGASVGMGNMTQANSISAAFRASFGIPVEKTGLIVTVLTILVVLGGIRGLSKLTTFLVPFMGLLYIFAAFAVIIANLRNLPEGIVKIFGMAICPRAFEGGTLGHITVSVMNSIRWGVARGVFSNEAGVGASGINAAAAGTDDYIKQGYISMTGVFFDTIVICFITGLAIAASGVLGCVDGQGQPLTGIELVTMVFGDSLGKWGRWLLAVSIALFAFATIAGWAYQGEKVFEYLMGSEKYNLAFRFVYALSAFTGAVMNLELVWMTADICNALMAVPNLISVLVLSGEAVREIREYK